MSEKQLKTKWIAVTISIFSILATVTIPSANAGILNWFSLTKGIEITANESTLSNSFIGLGILPFSIMEITDKNQTPMVINETFLAASVMFPEEPESQTTDATQNSNAIVIQEMIVPVTAYSSTPFETDLTPFITAKGSMVRDGIVAANFLPFGAKIKIPEVFGDKIFVIEDRMNKRYQHRIDIWFPDRQSALNFGIKILKVQILES